MNWLMGILCTLVGSSILLWIGYNFLVEMQPQAEGRNPAFPLVFSVLAIGTGISRLRKAVGRGQNADEGSQHGDDGDDELLVG